MKKILLSIAVVLSPFIPEIVFAQTNDLSGLISFGVSIINSLIPLLIGIAALVFFWGIIKYILAADPRKLVEARSYIIYGIIGIAVMLSVWSLSFAIRNLLLPGGSSGLPQFNGTINGVDYYPSGTGPTPPANIVPPVTNT